MSEVVEVSLDGAPEKIALVLEEYGIDSATNTPSLVLANAMLLHLQGLIQFGEYIRFVDAMTGWIDDDE